MNNGTPQPPQYRLRRKPAQPAVRSHTGRGTQWLAAAVGLLLTLALLGGLAWAAVSGFGSGRWVWAPASPSPTPGEAPAPASPTPLPTVSASKTGTVEGSAGFPAGTAPAQQICAESVSDSSVHFCTVFPGGNNLAYSFSLPAGTYYVYASLQQPQGSFNTSYRAYFDQYVQCTSNPSSSSNCPGSLHAKYLPVTVTSGTTISEVNPTDWYAGS
ncbi:MAG TPA: hypothetical protein VI322_00390 [Candidatus Saccharimonadia bacterium]